MKYTHGNMMKFKMTKQKIIIPDKVEYTKALVCLIDPITSQATISLTLEGEDEPFRTGKLQKRSSEIAAYVFRPRVLDEVNKKFTSPLKTGDILNVEVIVTDSLGKSIKVKQNVEVV